MPFRRWSSWAAVGMVVLLTAASALWSVARSPRPVPREASRVLRARPATATTTTLPIPESSTTTQPGPPPTFGVAASTWKVSSTSPAVPGVSQISCPSLTICYAAGTNSSAAGDILATTDGGAVWSSDSLPPTTGGVTGISCPTPEICFATEDDAVLHSSDSGGSWTDQKVPPGSVALDAVACPSTTVCYVVGLSSSEGATILGTTDAGATWTTLGVSSEFAGAGQTTELTAIACPSTTVCYTINGQADYFATTDAGRSWKGLTGLAAGGYGTAIACPSTTFCLTVGESGIVATTDAGASWVRQTVPLPTGGSGAGLSAVACPTTSTCYATEAIGMNDQDGGGEIIATTDSGNSWHITDDTPWYGGLSSIACPSTTSCFAGDNNTPTFGDLAGAIVATRNAGSSWQTQSLPAGVGPLPALACPSATTCYATTGAALLATADAGVSWQTQSLPAGTTSSSALACPAVTTCLLIATTLAHTNTEILATTNAGAAWRVLTVLPNDENPSALACLSPTTCFALGSDILATTDGGTTWNPRPLPAGENDLYGMVCPSTTICFGIGLGGVITTTDGGTTWRQEPALPMGLDADLTGISCTSPTSCLVVAENSNCHGGSGPCFPGTDAAASTRDAGATWTGDRIPPNISLTGVACPSATSCLAVTFDADANDYRGGAPGSILTTTDRGTSWSTEAVPPGTGQLNALACPTPTICYAAGEGLGATGGLILKN
ncbi:MAG TPA: hypothetical protein VNC61_13930 [Acidimicrobiales bacterium]|nr:hypothetical protein [Acidimicrobiales bacterium]